MFYGQGRKGGPELSSSTTAELRESRLELMPQVGQVLAHLHDHRDAGEVDVELVNQIVGDASPLEHDLGVSLILWGVPGVDLDDIFLLELYEERLVDRKDFDHLSSREILHRPRFSRTSVVP